MADLTWTTDENGFKQTTFTSGGVEYVQKVKYNSNNIPETYIYESVANGQDLLARVRNDGTYQLTSLGGSYGSTFENIVVKESLKNTKSLNKKDEDQKPKDPGPESKTPAEGSVASGLEQFDPGLFGGKENFGNLMYPKTMNSGQDRIFINQVQYKRSDVLQREGDFTKLDSVGSVTLPMPNDISETNSVGWGEDSLSNVAAGLMPGLIGAGAGVAEADFGQIKNGMKQLSDFVGGNSALSTRAKQFLTTKAAASLIAKLGVNVNAEAFITRSTGAAINPNLELLFNGPKLRQFGFQFKLTPRDGGEATEIRKILRFFKQGMSPRKGSGSAEFFLGTPNVFKIQFKSGNSELKSIGKIKTCALVSFNANYTPDGFYAAYKDGAAGGSQPVAVTIQLGFTELTPVFNDEYDSNYDDIGPNIRPESKNADTKSKDKLNFTVEEMADITKGKFDLRGIGVLPEGTGPTFQNPLTLPKQ